MVRQFYYSQRQGQAAEHDEPQAHGTGCIAGGDLSACFEDAEKCWWKCRSWVINNAISKQARGRRPRKRRAVVEGLHQVLTSFRPCSWCSYTKHDIRRPMVQRLQQRVCSALPTDHRALFDDSIITENKEAIEANKQCSYLKNIPNCLAAADRT